MQDRKPRVSLSVLEIWAGVNKYLKILFKFIWFFNDAVSLLYGSPEGQMKTGYFLVIHFLRTGSN